MYFFAARSFEHRPDGSGALDSHHRTGLQLRGVHAACRAIQRSGARKAAADRDVSSDACDTRLDFFQRSEEVTAGARPLIEQAMAIPQLQRIQIGDSVFARSKSSWQPLDDHSRAFLASLS